MLCSVDTMSGSEAALQGPPRDVYSSVHRPFIHRLIHSVDEAVYSTRWGSIGSEYPGRMSPCTQTNMSAKPPLAVHQMRHQHGATYV